MNHTVLLDSNCGRRCTYCNWKGSIFTPRRAPSYSELRHFLTNCDRSFVTISGSGEPLFNEHFERVAADIRSLGYKVRVITREVDKLEQFKHCIDHVSVSLDNEVMSKAKRNNRHGAEYTLVLPPVTTETVLKLIPQYLGIQSQLRGPLILRENLSSAHKLNIGKIMSETSFKVVSVAQCRESRYLADEPHFGYEMLMDVPRFATLLLNDSPYTVYGSFLRYLYDPVKFQTFGDIDLINTDNLLWLTRFGYTFECVHEGYPSYYIGKSPLMNAPKLHIASLLLFDVDRFIQNAQLDVDRLYVHRGKWSAEPGDVIRKEKVAFRRSVEKRDVTLFGKDRDRIEKHYEAKMVANGWRIINEED